LTDNTKKLLVGIGVSKTGYTTDMETFDLLQPENICSDLNPFPVNLEKSTAAVVGENVIVCGMPFVLFF
jgi:hypothetical protein